jgi:hypothetical protein
VGSSEREYPLLVLEPGPIRGEGRDAVAQWVADFEPLDDDFDAGHSAKAWLETNISAGVVPLDTYLVFSEEESELFGFFVLDEVEVEVAPYDRPIMKAHKSIDDVNVKRHPATKLVWIARSSTSPKGFGAEMFEHALVLATEARSCALLVDAADEDTAEKLWIGHYEFRKPRDGAAEWSCLWHSLGELNESFN